jgi:hypothetical protein
MISVQATPAAPAPTTTTLTSAAPVDDPQRIHQRGEYTIAVPCWSSWRTGMSSSARRRRSISKQRGAEMSSKLIAPNVGAAALTNSTMRSGSLGRQAQWERVGSGELFEQQRLFFHDRHRGLGADVAQLRTR